MIKEGCKCFTCRHKDEPRVIVGYLNGYKEASEWFLNWAKRNNIKMGSISEDDLGGLYAQMECNYDDTMCFLKCDKSLPNIEE